MIVTDINEIAAKAYERKAWVEAVRLTHYQRADWFRVWNNSIGVLAVVASTIVSAGILTSIHKRPSFGWTLAAAVVGVFATALTGVRAYLKLGALSEQHRTSAAVFGEIRRELEVFLLAHLSSDAGSLAQLAEIDQKISNQERLGPGYPSRVFHRKWKECKHDSYAREGE